ncbi:unnamed protein product [Kuraishia capsulata CBS 1993]|uniref:FAD synthase n=1 Tax=Kuraishia capsulata CBS 1993 TaxID=1382522 RepID=W6MMU7_9ASCO|nr:uncharacterized protein KUCA_T00003924001 [Kuraishia capsulata CBS 1993]CDK27944.1 unnamed protein product [Kuraishia capsulata CBS 1993]
MTLLKACQEAHRELERFLTSTPEDMFTENLTDSPEYTYTNTLLAKTRAQTRDTLNIFKEALKIYKLSEISVSYNGGKDCLVMLVILLAAIYDSFKNGELDDPQTKLNAVYINTEEVFEEQNKFLYSSVDHYKLSFVQIKKGMSEGFRDYLDMKPEVKAIVVGIRRIDPFGGDLSPLQKTDHGWPDFMRINPVLEWTYTEIWCFLKICKIPYCKLYDEGYTSIGGIDNTIKNPLLRVESSEDRFLPAYRLHEDDKERLSRVEKSSREKL